MAIQETSHTPRNTEVRVPKLSFSEAFRVITILLIVVIESIALFSIPDLTGRDALGIFVAAFAAGTLVLAL